MTDHRPPFDEFDLRQALSSQATTVRPALDPGRLHDGMVRADRLRTVRAAATAGVMAVVVALGVLNLQGVEERSLVDTVDQPDLVVPDPTVPSIDDATSEDAEVALDDTEDELVTVATTTAAPTTTLLGDPDHLTPPSTTGAPIAVVSTTAPPTTQPPTTTVPTTTAPPAPTTTAAPTTTSTAAPVLFSASARYGSCELDPPYDEYFGTAAPGATVTITSAHSAPTAVTADGNGDWAVTVFFPAAPANETFSVTVTDGAATSVFDFVHVVA